MAKKKAKLGVVEGKKLKLWQYSMERGWERREQPPGMNCLYNTAVTPERMRLRFGDKTLQLQIEAPLTKEEKKIQPHKTKHWVILDEAEYANVEIAEGGLIFHKEKKTVKKKRKTKGKE